MGEKNLTREVTATSHGVGESEAVNLKTGSTDDATLSALGYQSELNRSIGFGSILAAGWNACNSWAGLSVTLVTALAQGGTVTVLYGEIIMLVVIGMTALSVAELSSSFPTAGGQYHYSSILAPQALARALSYLTGTVNIFAWIVTTASVTLTIPQLVLGVVAQFHPDYVFQRWHAFIIYEFVNVFILAFNIFLLNHVVRLVHRTGLVLSITLFAVSIIACTTRASPKQSGTFVWTTFTNESGWKSSGLVFLTGLINPNFMYVGIDCAIHLAEECRNAAIAVPRAILSVIVIGFVTAFPFSIAMFYCLSDFATVADTTTGQPIYELWMQATRSTAGGTALVLTLIVIQFFCNNACQQTASRLTWSMGRDNAFLLSRHIGAVHPRFGVPVWALVFNATIVGLVGILYLASTTAFNSMIGTCLILVQASYAIPNALLLARKRTGLLPTRTVRLGVFGWVVNSVTVLWALENLIVYCLPFEHPVTDGNMNYASVVLVVMFIFGALNWFFWARYHYYGPRIDQGITVVEK